MVRDLEACAGGRAGGKEERRVEESWSGGKKGVRRGMSQGREGKREAMRMNNNRSQESPPACHSFCLPVSSLPLWDVLAGGPSPHACVHTALPRQLLQGPCHSTPQLLLS